MPTNPYQPPETKQSRKRCFALRVLIATWLTVTGLSAVSFALSSNHPMMDGGSVYGISLDAAACLGAAIAGAIKGWWEIGAAIGFAFGLVAIVVHFYVVFPFFYWER